jgi:2-dehydro-3-deoxy-D-gluconate 5-dehydrogenase
MKNDLFSVEGHVAIVTGGSRGLGKAMAAGLAQAGAKVVIADILDPSETVEEITKDGSHALGIKVDVTKKEDVENMVGKTIEKFGHIDILVNNAGILRTGKAEDLSLEDWNKVIQVNLTGQFICAQVVAKHMLERGKGNIINISSIAGLRGYPGSVVYSAAKAGSIMMTKTCAAEWGHTLRVNAICPGVFASDMTDDFLKDEKFMQDLKQKVPMGRHATPDELIGTVIYLASKASSYVNGHELVIDGGWISAL